MSFPINSLRDKPQKKKSKFLVLIQVIWGSIPENRGSESRFGEEISDYKKGLRIEVPKSSLYLDTKAHLLAALVLFTFVLKYSQL